MLGGDRQGVEDVLKTQEWGGSMVEMRTRSGDRDGMAQAALTWLNLFSFSRSRCSSWTFLNSRECIRSCKCVISVRKKALSSCSWRRDWGCKSIVVIIASVVGGVTSPVIRMG